MRPICYLTAMVIFMICLFGCAVKSAFDQEQFAVPKDSYLEQQIQKLDVEIAELGMQSWPDYQAFHNLLANRFIDSQYVLFDRYLWPNISREGIGYWLHEQDHRRIENTVGSFLKVLVAIKKYKERPKFSEALSKFKAEKMPLEWRDNLLTDVSIFFEKETK